MPRQLRSECHGSLRRAYDYYVKELTPRGFQLQVEIVDWPGGMPGDVGIFIGWPEILE